MATVRAASSPAAPAPSAAPEPRAVRLWTLAFGAFLGLALLKFPNPALLDHLVTPPANGWEWALSSWPLRYAFVPLLVLLVTGAGLARRATGAGRAVWLPLAWLAWVGLSALAAASGERPWSGLTLLHHAAGVVCFYLGLLVAGRTRGPWWFLAGLLAAMAVVCLAGWQQHFGGLEETRRYFYAYTYPNLTEVNPDQLKRINSNRIFGTLFYPNSLAGAVLLLTPALLGGLADARKTFTPGARTLLLLGLGVAAAGCLVWSGSKTGWLLALGLGLLVLLRWPLARTLKIALVAVVLLAGLAGFAARYAGFFHKGASSVVARFDYWRAGLTMVGERPLFGAGPGLFGAGYKRLKPPEAEMAQLAHNDYLQQAADSGLPAATLFAGLVAGVLWRGRRLWRHPGWLEWGAWLGLLALAAQSLVEFGFMVPATAWCWFGLAGWLWRRTLPDG